MGEKNLYALIFAGGAGDSDIEKVLKKVHYGILLDNLDKICKADGVDRVVVVTAYPDLAEQMDGFPGVVTEGTWGREFHFGVELQNIINRHRPGKVMYLGDAGFPLLSGKDMEMFIAGLAGRENLVLTNNPQSSDLVAFTPAAAINMIEPTPDDNSLAISLRDQAGLAMELLPGSPGLIYDIDTPTDMLILAAGPFAGPRTKTVLEGFPLDFSALERAKEVLRGYYREVVLIGRVGAPLIAYLNCNLQVRLRIFSEERGMKALGRESAGLVESLLAYLIDELGLPKFFSYLEKVAEAAFIDTRVFLAHYKLKLPTRDRYMSDLGQWQEVQHPWLRDFTRFASECSIPVILGGHSLVSGGLWILANELTESARK